VIRVLIVEDQTLVCEGLEMLLGLMEDIRVAGRAADGIEALHSMREQAPDLVRMPKMSGIEVLREMKAKALAIPVILLTTFDDDAALLEGIRLGAKGYLLKDVSLAKLTESIRLVAAGRLLALSLLRLARGSSCPYHRLDRKWAGIPSA
jgi:DNA-binding NarL/FixJ family response regulator